MTTDDRLQRFFAFGRSILLIVVLVIVAPSVLAAVARSRFGGASPFAGVPAPSSWSADAIWSTLGNRLTDDTIADVVIRTALAVVWMAVAVIIVTTVAEVFHVVRHGGLSLPPVRGLGFSQRAARLIAAGLIVVTPLVTPQGRLAARTPSAAVSAGSAAVPTRVLGDVPGAATVAHLARPMRTDQKDDAILAPDDGKQYRVRPGDSIYAIAERIAGPDRSDVHRFADRMIELNLGRVMDDGQRFANAAYIDVGWTLELPEPTATEEPTAVDHVAQHAVVEGESLWSIAHDELGDGVRWQEIFDRNVDREQPDGRALEDPNVIHPGWVLDVVRAPSPQEVVVPLQPTSAEPSIPEPTLPVDDEQVTNPPSTAASSDVADAVAPVTEQSVDDGVTSEAADRTDLPAPGSLLDPASDMSDEALLRTSSTTSMPAAGQSPEATAADDSARSPFRRLGAAAMLSAGVITLLGVRRRARLRGARPRSRLPEPSPHISHTERVLRLVDFGERFARVDIAVRASAMNLIEHGQRVVAVLADLDGTVELIASGPVDLAGPWRGSGARWTLDGATPLELLAPDSRRVGGPCPTLVQLGETDDGREVYVDLEALGVLRVDAHPATADAVVSAVAATLASSVLAEVTTLVGVDVPVAVFLGHRHHHSAPNVVDAINIASSAVGSTAAMRETTFELRARATSGETWEPAVVLLGADESDHAEAAHGELCSGVAVVTARPFSGSTATLVQDSDGWLLHPLDVRLTPIGLAADDVVALADLVEAAALPAIDAKPHVDDVNDVAADERSDDSVVQVHGDQTPPWRLLVRLLGPVEVIDQSGHSVRFERSKTKELVAWLATHRERSTRAAARTALWELDVRDATFANVVSEARRALARLVDPPDGEEWVGRTLTEALPLHELVLTDTDLVRAALDAARLVPPAEAIATLRPVMDWISGLPFEGTSYLWPDAEGITSNLVLLATSAATELAAHSLSVGDVDGVFLATGRGLQVLPGHEELIALRMRAHANAGDLAGVRQEWESYERVINADPWSDGEPAPKLLELRRELLSPST